MKPAVMKPSELLARAADVVGGHVDRFNRAFQPVGLMVLCELLGQLCSKTVREVLHRHAASGSLRAGDVADFLRATSSLQYGEEQQ